MNIEIENDVDMNDLQKKKAELTPLTKQWSENRLAIDLLQQRKAFIDSCRRLGISAIRIREKEVTVSFYAKVMEQEYGIETTIQYRGSLLDIAPQVKEAVKLWYIQIMDLIKETGKAKGIL